MISAVCTACGGMTPHVNTTCLICLSPEERLAYLGRELIAIHAPTGRSIEMAVTDGEGAESEEEM